MPKLEMSDSFGHWLEMNNMQASQFNSVCDNVEERWKAKKGASMMEDNVDKSQSAGAALSYTQTVIGVVVGVLALVGISVGVGCYIQKTKQSQSDIEIEYNKM